MNRTIHKAFCAIFFCMTIIVHAKADPAVSGISVVVIDPGHGGRDWGASAGNVREKDIVLDIARKLGNIIKTNYPEIQIQYTRTKDVFIPLHERAETANKSKANLFISLHVNSVAQKYVQGAETFILGQHRTEENLEVAKKENAVILLEEDYSTTYEGFDPNLPESYIMFELVQDEYLEQSAMLASEIQNQFRVNANRIDRSVKQAGFLVLRRTTMPGVLVEMGFISNESDRKYLLSESGKTNIAQSIFRAFKTYKTKFEEKNNFNVVASFTQKEQLDSIEKAPESQPVKAQILEESTIYFSVQIMALRKKLDTIPENFKGEKNIFRTEADRLYRYYSGKFETLEAANAEKIRLKKIFKGAYVVAFENNKIISVKKAVRKNENQN